MKHIVTLKSIYTLIIVFGIIAAIFAKLLIRKYSSIALKYESKNLVGKKALVEMLKYYNVNNITIQKQDGIFNDRYVPGTKTIILCGISNSSPSLIGVGSALHQGCYAIQDEKIHVLNVLKYIVIFVIKTASMAATIAIPFIFFFDIVLKIVLIIYAVDVIVNVLMSVIDLCGLRFAYKYLDSVKYYDDEQDEVLKKFMFSESLSYIATAFSPIMLVIKLLLDRNKNLVEEKRNIKEKKYGKVNDDQSRL